MFLFKPRKDSHCNHVQLGQYGRNRTNVWNYPCANIFSRSGEEGNLLAIHPTVKPAALMGDAIMECTERGSIVLDSFLGSGTTVVAAERTGRRCYGLEIDPGYVDTIVRRWQAFTRDAAIHSESGRSFAEIEGEVRGRCGSATTKNRPSPIATIKWATANRPNTHVSNPDTPAIRVESQQARWHPATILKRTLLEEVVVKQHGREIKTTKLEVFIAQIINQAMRADYHFVLFLFRHAGLGLKLSEATREQGGGIPPEEADLIRRALLGEDVETGTLSRDKRKGEPYSPSGHVSDQSRVKQDAEGQVQRVGYGHPPPFAQGFKRVIPEIRPHAPEYPRTLQRSPGGFCWNRCLLSRAGASKPSRDEILSSSRS